MSQGKPDAEGSIPLSIENAPAVVAIGLQLPGAIVIGRHANGDIIVNFTEGLDHRTVVEALSVAIHAVMSEHDRQILAGRAGAAAQKRFEDLRNFQGVTDASLSQ